MKRWMHEWIDKREIVHDQLWYGLWVKREKYFNSLRLKHTGMKQCWIKKLKQRRHSVCQWWLEEWRNKNGKNRLFIMPLSPSTQNSSWERWENFTPVLVTCILLDYTKFWEEKNGKTSLERKWGMLKIYLLTD